MTQQAVKNLSVAKKDVYKRQPITYAHEKGYAHLEFMDAGLPFKKHGYRDFILPSVASVLTSRLAHSSQTGLAFSFCMRSFFQRVESVSYTHLVILPISSFVSVTDTFSPMILASIAANVGNVNSPTQPLCILS